MQLFIIHINSRLASFCCNSPKPQRSLKMLIGCCTFSHIADKRMIAASTLHITPPSSQPPAVSMLLHWRLSPLPAISVHVCGRLGSLCPRSWSTWPKQQKQPSKTTHKKPQIAVGLLPVPGRWRHDVTRAIHIWRPNDRPVAKVISAFLVAGWVGDGWWGGNGLELWRRIVPKVGHQTGMVFFFWLLFVRFACSNRRKVQQHAAHRCGILIISTVMLFILSGSWQISHELINYTLW